MRRHRNATIAALGMVWLVAVGPAPAATPVWTAPTTIGSSGVYEVTNNITAGGTSVIAVVGTGVEDVVIDLKGYTLTVSGGMHAIDVLNVRSVVVRNGVIVDSAMPSGDGVHVVGAQWATVQQLQIFSARDGVHLENTAVFTVEGSQIHVPENAGIYANGMAVTGPMTGAIKQNDVIRAGMVGIHLETNHDSVEVIENRVDRVPAGDGIVMRGGAYCVVEGNRVRGASGSGILLDVMSFCLVHDNRVRNNNDGIVVSATDDSNFDENLCAGNAVDGIRVGGDRNSIKSNEMRGNGGTGLFFEPPADNNFFQHNVSQGNAAASGTCPAPACPGLTAPDFCDDGAGNTSGGGNWAPGPPAC
jgi:parallel beta-helix repeat protein